MQVDFLSPLHLVILEILTCSFVWNIFLCWLILFNTLCLCSLFLKLQHCNSSFCLEYAPWWMTLVQGDCAGFLVEELVPAHWWVELDLVPLVGQGHVTEYAYRQLLVQDNFR